MKFLNQIVWVLCMTSVMVACSKEDVETLKPVNLPEKAAIVIKADNSFGLDLYTRLAANATAGTNLMISPLSVSQALSMTYNGANGETQLAFEEAMKMIGFDREELNELNKAIVTALVDHDPQVMVSIANSIWYRKKYSVLQSFIDLNKNMYNAEIRPMDFSDPECKNVINLWVSDKTHNRIKEIVDEINPESLMFLINAVYFKGAWSQKFDPKLTVQQSFYKEDGTVTKMSMMHSKMDLNVLANDVFTSVELPFGTGNWRMLLFLPGSGKSVADVEQLFSNDQWNQWLTQYDSIPDVELSLPKFSFSYDTCLKDVLTAMGMGIAFTDQADFTGILPDGGLMISDVKHKTFIEVNEDGAEAAAATSVEMVLTSLGRTITFNKPFLFAIAEKSTGVILFLGRQMGQE